MKKCKLKFYKWINDKTTELIFETNTYITEKEAENIILLMKIIDDEYCFCIVPKGTE